MKSPAHPGRILKGELEHLNVPVAKAAEALGVTRQQLHNVIAGRSAVSAEMAIRLELAIGGTADAWTEMQRAFDLSQVRERSADIASQVTRLAPEAA